MRIVSWNLGHQTRERRLKPVFLPSVCALKPDVLVLNEYVDGPSRVGMRAAFREYGLVHTACSERLGIHNQILIASRYPLDSGTLGPVMLDETAMSNFLSVALPSRGIEIAGLRTPAYKAVAAKKVFWGHMDSLIRSVSDRAILFIGDLNADPLDNRSIGGRVLAALCRDGWQVPIPRGEWSYCGHKARTRIDHAVVSPNLRVTDSAYWSEIDGSPCAGRGRALYDHAPLSVDVVAAAS